MSSLLLITLESIAQWTVITLNTAVVIVMIATYFSDKKKNKRILDENHLNETYVNKLDYEKDKSNEMLTVLENIRDITKEFHKILDKKLVNLRTELKKDVMNLINLATKKYNGG